MEQRGAGKRGRRLSRWVIAATFLLAATSGITAAPPDEAAAIPASIRDQQPLRQYRAFRRMHARSDHFGQEAWVEVWTEMDGQTFRYTIVSERGSDYIRDKVLKTILQREQELVA